MVTLANGFVARGLRVDLVLVKTGGVYSDEIHPEIRVVDLKAGTLRRGLPPLIRYLRRTKPRVLLSALNGANVAAILARSLAFSPTRVVLTQHNTLRHRAWDGPETRRSLSRPLIPRLYRHADRIIAVSQGLAEELLDLTKLPRDRVVTIYNPVITPELFRLAQEPVDHPWFQVGSDPVILGVGRLVPQKDFPTLLRAFARVRASRRARLVILGEGPERARLQQLAYDLGIDSEVDMPGFVRNPYAWMARASLFVLSSAWEGFGVVLVEAMACGTPVVSTDCPHGPAEILQGGRYGMLVPVGDEAAMADAILRVLEGHPARVSSEAVERFRLEPVLNSYLRVLSPFLPSAASLIG